MTGKDRYIYFKPTKDVDFTIRGKSITLRRHSVYELDTANTIIKPRNFFTGAFEDKPIALNSSDVVRLFKLTDNGKLVKLNEYAPKINLN